MENKIHNAHLCTLVIIIFWFRIGPSKQDSQLMSTQDLLSTTSVPAIVVDKVEDLAPNGKDGKSDVNHAART